MTLQFKPSLSSPDLKTISEVMTIGGRPTRVLTMEAGAVTTIDFKNAPRQNVILKRDTLIKIIPWFDRSNGRASASIVLAFSPTSTPHTVFWPGGIRWGDDTPPCIVDRSCAVSLITSSKGLFGSVLKRRDGNRWKFRGR